MVDNRRRNDDGAMRKRPAGGPYRATIAYNLAVAERKDEIEGAKQAIESRIRLAQIGVAPLTPSKAGHLRKKRDDA